MNKNLNTLFSRIVHNIVCACLCKFRAYCTRRYQKQVDCKLIPHYTKRRFSLNKGQWTPWTRFVADNIINKHKYNTHTTKYIFTKKGAGPCFPRMCVYCAHMELTLEFCCCCPRISTIQSDTTKYCGGLPSHPTSHHQYIYLSTNNKHACEKFIYTRARHNARGDYCGPSFYILLLFIPPTLKITRNISA